MSDFLESIHEHFSFLEKDYDCNLEYARLEEWGGEAVYRNVTTGVKIVYEIPSAFIYVFIYKLIGGEMVENPRPLYSDSVITCFDFNDALDDEDKMKPAYAYGSNAPYHDENTGLSSYVKEFSTRLKGSGCKLLEGDFRILPKIEKIIKARVSGGF